MKQGQAKVVYRHLAFLGPESTWAAEAVECAGDQGRFWEYHDKLFAEQAGRNQGVFSRENLKRFAVEIGLQPEPFSACVDSGRYTARVLAETEAGRQKGVRSVPTIFVNGSRLEGPPTYENLLAAIAAAR